MKLISRISFGLAWILKSPSLFVDIPLVFADRTFTVAPARGDPDCASTTLPVICASRTQGIASQLASRRSVLI